MERLLAYEGPVVHVDHSHRAPAPTGGTREDAVPQEDAVARERKECNEHLQKVHDDHEANTAWEKNRIVELQKALLDKEKAFRDASAYNDRVEARHAKEVEELERKLQEERQHKETAQKKHEWAVKEMAKEEADRMQAKEDCDRAVAELHNNYTRAAKGDADEIVKLQRELKAKEEELVTARFQIKEMQASDLTRSKVINEYYEELAEDNQNYTKLLNGAYNEAKSKFVVAHAMARSKAEDGDPVALQYIRWVQKKLAALPEMDEDKARASVGMWF